MVAVVVKENDRALFYLGTYPLHYLRAGKPLPIQGIHAPLYRLQAEFFSSFYQLIVVISERRPEISRLFTRQLFDLIVHIRQFAYYLIFIDLGHLQMIVAVIAYLTPAIRDRLCFIGIFIQPETNKKKRGFYIVLIEYFENFQGLIRTPRSIEGKRNKLFFSAIDAVDGYFS